MLPNSPSPTPSAIIPPMGTSSAPPPIHALIAKFQSHASHYRSPAYNEEQTRHDFINPFFEALGWDIANTAGYADAYRDVVLEQTLHIAGSSSYAC